eukprot:TRINITY_DN9345_c0_g1_i1.p1 TRINITY_DN9345_c0_g1~~TRINITY_DN9345_c0_g1_i1.p1  ORF type:complete len:222 (-),score=43.41 TRINITY_DN9345_c0_g1_i1:114-779(-)
MWTFGASSSNTELVMNLKKQGIVKTPETEAAMKAVDRADFVPQSTDPYYDSPQPIGHSVTISAPHMHAMCLELMRDRIINNSNPKVLDVGSGSGYLVAALAHLVGENGKVYGIETIPQLVTWSLANMKKNHQHFLDSGRVHIQVGDGWKGLPEQGPFDAIHVGAAASEIPTALVEQLRVGGVLIIPVGVDNQYLMEVSKDSPTSYSSKAITAVRYVPLVKH